MATKIRCTCVRIPDEVLVDRHLPGHEGVNDVNRCIDRKVTKRNQRVPSQANSGLEPIRDLSKGGCHVSTGYLHPVKWRQLSDSSRAQDSWELIEEGRQRHCS